MTETAQRDIVIGALCSDAQFRRDIFSSTSEGQVVARVNSYAADNDVPVNENVARDVWRLLVNSQERTQYLSGFDGEALLMFCRVWPCRRLDDEPLEQKR